MAQSIESRTQRYPVLGAILNPRLKVPGLTPEMEPGLRVARRLTYLFVAILAFSFLQSFWANFVAGTDLPLVPVALHGGAKQEKARVRLHLTPKMNPMRLLFRRKVDPRFSISYYVTVRDAAGNIVARSTPGDYGSSRPPESSSASTSHLDIFEVREAGDYAVEVEANQVNATTAIQDAAVGVQRNAQDSHFILTVLLMPFAVWLASKWWRREHGWIIDELMGDAEAGTPPPPAAPVPVTSPAAPVRFQLRALSPPEPTAMTPLEPVPVVPRETAADAPPTSPARIGSRLALEAWSLLLSAIQVPIVGAYTMLALIVGVGALAGSSPGTMDAVMKSPITAMLADWFFPKGHYEGFDAAWQMGQAGGVVVLVFHLLMMPLRAFWPGQRRTLTEKAKLLIKANLIFLVAALVSFLASGMNLGKAIDGVTICGILLAIIYVPAVVLMSISTKLQEVIDAKGNARGAE